MRVLAFAIQVPFRPVDAHADSADAKLVDRLLHGDVAALGEAYELHHTHVRAFTRRFLGEDAAAEDLLQETFLALPRAVRRFRREGPLRTFLVALALNHARHHVRAAARRRAAMGRLAAEPPPPGEGPDDTAVRNQLADAHLRALDRLPMDQRAAVVLCDVEERSSTEAAMLAIKRTSSRAIRRRRFKLGTRISARFRTAGSRSKLATTAPCRSCGSGDLPKLGRRSRRSRTETPADTGRPKRGSSSRFSIEKKARRARGFSEPNSARSARSPR